MLQSRHLILIVNEVNIMNVTMHLNLEAFEFELADSQVIDECVSVNMRQAQLEKEYYEKFKKILSPKKLYRYKRAEGKFAREFMRGGDDRKEENRKK